MTVIATRCDFCSRPFNANAWNQRTCVACEVAGAPDQSVLEWKSYEKALKDYLRAKAGTKRKPLHGAAARSLASASFSPQGLRTGLKRRMPRVPKAGSGKAQRSNP